MAEDTNNSLHFWWSVNGAFIGCLENDLRATVQGLKRFGNKKSLK